MARQQQSQGEIREHMAEQLEWRLAERDDEAVAQALYAGEAVGGVHTLDEAGVLDGSFVFVKEAGVMAVWQGFRIASSIARAANTCRTPVLDPALLAQPHVTGPDRQPVKAALYPYHRPWAPSSGLVSNVEDMTRWMVVGANRGELDGARILSPAAYDLLWGNEADTGVNGPAGKPLYYGLGWYVFEAAGKTQVGHPGLNLGFVADIGYFPDERTGAIAMANRLDSMEDARVSEAMHGSIYRLLGIVP